MDAKKQEHFTPVGNTNEFNIGKIERNHILTFGTLNLQGSWEKGPTEGAKRMKRQD